MRAERPAASLVEIRGRTSERQTAPAAAECAQLDVVAIAVARGVGLPTAGGAEAPQAPLVVAEGGSG